MSREAKVNLAIEMSSVATALTIDSIRDKRPGISEAKLLTLARKRFYSGRTHRRLSALPTSRKR
jgi:hypothetical protein